MQFGNHHTYRLGACKFETESEWYFQNKINSNFVPNKGTLKEQEEPTSGT